MKDENRRSETAALSDPRIKRRDESGGEFGGAGGEFHETVGADETGEIARGVEGIGGGEEFEHAVLHAVAVGFEVLREAAAAVVGHWYGSWDGPSPARVLKRLFLSNPGAARNSQAI